MKMGRAPRNIYALLPVSLFVIQVVLLGFISYRYFPTRNEVAHLPAGLTHWNPGVFSVYSANPPLWRTLAVLPVIPFAPNLEGVTLPSMPGQRTEWGSARSFAEDNAANYWCMVRLSRIAGILWSVLGGILIYSWSRQLYGSAAGLLGLVLWCFDPMILGHGPLLTPDMPLTVGVFGSIFLLREHLKSPTWEGTVLCGIALGLAQLTKFTALVLYGVWPVLWLVHFLSTRGERVDGGRSIRWFVLHAVVIFTISILVINMGYAFDSSFRPLKEFQFVSEMFRGDQKKGERIGNRFSDSSLGEIPVPFPAEYVQGIDLQRRDFEGKIQSYLRGEIRESGWWYYYAYAFLVKVPLGTIALVLWAAVVTLMRRPKEVNISDDFFLWLPPLVIFAFVSSQTGFNHHFRYVLPIFPFLFVAVSRLGCYLQPFQWRKAVSVLFLFACSVGRSLSIFPHSMSYFNELAGGPNNGHNHLINSNIDWGQDLGLLKAWVDEHSEARPFSLAYFNFIDYKRIMGMDFPEPPRDPPKDRANLRTEDLSSVGPHPGYFGVDVHNLKAGPYTYFERFRPIAKAGYSIFIYRITPEEADAARREMDLPPLPVPKQGPRSP